MVQYWKRIVDFPGIVVVGGNLKDILVEQDFQGLVVQDEKGIAGVESRHQQDETLAAVAVAAVAAADAVVALLSDAGGLDFVEKDWEEDTFLLYLVDIVDSFAMLHKSSQR